MSDTGKVFTREQLCTAAAEVWTKTMFPTADPEKVINISVALMQLMGHVYDNYGKPVENRPEHDRQIAEKAWAEGWEEGQYCAECIAGGRNNDPSIKRYPDNPYRKDND